MKYLPPPSSLLLLNLFIYLIVVVVGMRDDGGELFQKQRGGKHKHARTHTSLYFVELLF